MMDTYWTCSECGSANSYPDIKECEVCGKEIDETEALNAEKSIELIKAALEEEKRREREEEEKRRREEEERDRKKEIARKLLLKKEKAEKRAKLKNDVRRKGRQVEKYVGLVLSAIMIALIVWQTVRMSSGSGVTAGWILFIILAILSVIVSGLLYISLNEDLHLSFTNFVPSGLVGAFTLACTVSDLWTELILGMFEDGILSAILTGWLYIIIFLVLLVLAIAIIGAITHLLPAYLQEVFVSDTLGGIVGLVISGVAAGLFLSFVESDGVALVLG